MCVYIYIYHVCVCVCVYVDVYNIMSLYICIHLMLDLHASMGQCSLKWEVVHFCAVDLQNAKLKSLKARDHACIYVYIYIFIDL